MLTNSDITWYWSEGISLAYDWVGTKPWPLPNIEGTAAVTIFKLTDLRYLTDTNFKRIYDIIVEVPAWDIHRGIKLHNYTPGVLGDTVTLIGAYPKLIEKIRYYFGSLPKYDEYCGCSTATLTNWVTTYVNSDSHMRRVPYLTDVNTLLNTNYIKDIQVAALRGVVPGANDSTIPGITIPTDDTPPIFDTMADIIMFLIVLGLSSYIVTITDLTDVICRVVACYYIAVGIGFSFPPIRDIIVWVFRLVIAIFKGNLLQFILESIFWLIGKILEMLVYLLLKLMEFIMWIPIIGWPFIPFYYWLKSVLFPGNTDKSHPDGIKLIWYGITAFLAAIASAYVGRNVQTDSPLSGFLILLPNVVACYVYILFKGPNF